MAPRNHYVALFFVDELEDFEETKLPIGSIMRWQQDRPVFLLSDSCIHRKHVPSLSTTLSLCCITQYQASCLNASPRIRPNAGQNSLRLPKPEHTPTPPMKAEYIANVSTEVRVLMCPLTEVHRL